MDDHLKDPRFGDKEPYALGVEEELFLVDAASGELLDAREQVLGSLPNSDRGEITGEVHACQVEVITDVCRSAAEAARVLSALRRDVLATGVGVIGAGTHPSAPEAASEISDVKRYRFISGQLGDALMTPVAALHVHVGMPDEEAAIRAFNGLRRHLPLLEALAANSPFRHGRDTSFQSSRELALRAWARSGTPREMADYADFAEYAGRLTRAAQVADYSFHWWKLRPHPKLGTVEVRTLDSQSSLEHTASLAALVHCLARHEATAEPQPGPAPEILEEASYRAGRDGLTAELPDRDGSHRRVAEVLKEALAVATDYASDLGCERELADLEELVEVGGEAAQQRADYDRGGMSAVLAGLAERTAAVYEA